MSDGRTLVEGVLCETIDKVARRPELSTPSIVSLVLSEAAPKRLLELVEKGLAMEELEEHVENVKQRIAKELAARAAEGGSDDGR